MKQFLQIPVNSYFFRGKRNAVMLKRCLNQCVGNFSAIAAVQDFRQEKLTKPMLLSKKQKNISMGKKFSSQQSQKNLILMDFDVWLYPKLSRIIRSIYNFFVLKEMDSSFSVTEFTRNSVIALQVVTALLSELRFSELEGLLTEKCKEEVEKNLQHWPRDQISVLAIKPDKIINICPCEISVYSDENSNKVFAEIRIIHYVWLSYSSKFEKLDFYNTPLGRNIFNEISTQAKLGKIYMYGVFNSKFIREFTKGVADQWTVNAINVKCYSDVVSV